jgi:hypothetical protein
MDIVVEHAGCHLTQHPLVIGSEVANLDGHARLR